jgi:hypothetical protein
LEDQFVSLRLASLLRPVRLGRPYQEHKVPAGIALKVIEARKPSTTAKWRHSGDFRNTSSTTKLKREEIVDAPGKDGNGSMQEQVKRPNPWRKKKKMMMMMKIMRDPSDILRISPRVLGFTGLIKQKGINT